jgi:O-antigen ligase
MSKAREIPNAVNFLIYLAVAAVLIYTPLVHGAVQTRTANMSIFLVFTAAALWAVKLSVRGRFSFRKSPVNFPLAMFLIAATLSFTYSVYRFATLKSLYGIWAYALLFLVIINTFKDAKALKKLVLLIITMGGVVSLIGILNRYFGIPIPGISSSDVFNSFSTFVSASNFSGYVGMIFPIALALLFCDIDYPRKAYCFAAALIMLFAEFSCMDKGGWIQFMASGGFVLGAFFLTGYFKKSKWPAILAVVFFVWVLAVLGLRNIIDKLAVVFTSDFGNSAEATVWERWIYWKDTLKIIKDNLFLGTGLGTFRYVYPLYRSPQILNMVRFAHNDFLQLFAESGIIGIGLFFSLILVFFAKAFRVISRHPGTFWNGTAIGATAGIFGLLVHGLYDFNLHIPSNAFLFSALAAILVARSSLLAQKNGMDKIHLSVRYPAFDKPPLSAGVRFLSGSAAVALLFFVSLPLRNMCEAERFSRQAKISQDNLRITEAINYYEKAIGLCPLNAEYYYRLGELYMARSRFPSAPKGARNLKLADESFHKAIRLNRYDGKSYLALGQLYLNSGDLSRAEKYYFKALSVDPNNAFYHTMLGLFYLNSGRQAKAELRFKKALSINPNEPIARKNLIKSPE